MFLFACNKNTAVHGCLDSTACNYNSTATIDNNSCKYEIDCNGECGGSYVEDCAGNCENVKLNVELWGKCYNIQETKSLVLARKGLKGEIKTIHNQEHFIIHIDAIQHSVSIKIGRAYLSRL